MSSHRAAQQNALFCNQGVTSSNLVGGTSKIKGKRKMPKRDEMSGGTPGAQSPDFLSNLVKHIVDIGTSHKLDWDAHFKAYETADVPDVHRPRRSTIHSLWTGQLKSAIERAVQQYRSAPPPPPSRVKRDFYEPAIKTASLLSSHLQNDFNQNLLASAFNSYDEALHFMNQLQKLSTVDAVDEDIASRRKVEALCAEHGITISDPEPYILENFGSDALAEYEQAASDVEELDKKPRRDAIRFGLACEVVEAVGMPLSFGYNEDEIPRHALSEMVTVVIEAVGTYPGTPKPDEDYFARSVTKEAIEYVAAHNRYMAVCSKYDI